MNKYDKGFDREGFIEYIEDRYELNPYALQIVYNIIDEAQKHHHVSKDMFAEFLYDMLKGIDGIDFLKIAEYCESCILTDSTLKELGRI